MKKEKGTRGYLKQKKIYQLLLTLACMIGVLVFIMIGFFVNKSVENMFTVIAVVLVIPASKFLVGYIVLIPYVQPDEKFYQRVFSNKYELLTELVITSTEKIMGVDFVAVKSKRVYCYISDKKIDKNYLEKYIKEIISEKYEGVGVKVFTDEEKYVLAVNGLEQLENDNLDNKISHHLCLYSM